MSLIRGISPHIFANIVRKLHSGDPIADHELTDAIEVFESIMPYIDVLGDRFSLFFKELDSDYRQLLNFRESRKLK
jgi:hypothetical protein